MTVGELRCEYSVNPLGIDTLVPRLNWTLADDERGQRQSAYQIRVAEAAQDPEQANGLVWDSGKVVSDQNTGIVYAGPRVRSGARYQRAGWQRPTLSISASSS